MDDYLDYFQFGTMMHTVALNTHVHVLSVFGYKFSLKIKVILSFSKLVLYPRCFNFLKNSIEMVKLHRKYQYQQDFNWKGRHDPLKLTEFFIWPFLNFILCLGKCKQRNDTRSTQNARKGRVYQGLQTFFLQVYNSLRNTVKLIGTNLFNVIDFLRQTE